MSELLDRFMEPDRRQTRVRRLQQDRPSQAPRTRAATIWHRYNAVEYSIVFDDGGRGPADWAGHRQLEVGERVRATWAPEIHRYEIQALGQTVAGSRCDVEAGAIAIDVTHNSEYKVESPRTEITIGDAIYRLVSRGGSMVVWKSDDCAATWGQAATLASAPEFIDAWYDKAAGNSAGDNKWHIAWIDQTNDGVRYASFDFDTETFSTPIQVYTATGIVLDSNAHWCSITRARGGNLLIAFEFGGALAQPHENGLYRSTDGGVNWAARANIAEADGGDYCLLFPDFAGDDGDVTGLYVDQSADEFSIKRYDDSLNTVTETVVASGAAGGYSGLFGAAIRDSDGSLFPAVVNVRADAANGKVRMWRVLGATATALTDVATGAYLQACTAVQYDQANDVLYVVYVRDPDEADLGSVKAYWRKSPDVGTTWSDEAEVSAEETFINNVFLDPGHADSWLFLPCWFDDGTGSVGDGNDHETDPGAGAELLPPVPPSELVSHDDLSGVSADDHHAKSHAHDGADGSGTVAHSATTGQTADDHHTEDHASRHESGAADELDGGALAFTPTTSGDWDGPPTTVQAALDELASRMRALEP